VIVSVALLMIGVADIVRTALVRAAPVRDAPARPADAPDRRPAVALAASAVSAAVLAVASSAALGLAVPWSLACLATTLVWVVLVPVGRASGPSRDASRDAPPLWPTLVLLVLLVTTLCFDRTSVALPAGLDDVLGGSPRTLLHGTSAETVLAVMAVVAVMTQTANLVVRAALGRDRTVLVRPDARTTPSSTEAGTSATSARWSIRVGGRTIGAVQREAAAPSATTQPEVTTPLDVTAERTAPSGDTERAEQPGGRVPGTPAADALASSATTVAMRGGRHIGPVERVLVLAALLAGAYPVVAGLLAAKGIVRFPEIAEDSASGNKAEEFLVGSMTSWSIAAAGAGYIALVSAG